MTGWLLLGLFEDSSVIMLLLVMRMPDFSDLFRGCSVLDIIRVLPNNVVLSTTHNFYRCTQVVA